MPRGTPLEGDRAVQDALNHPTKHANDIDAATGIHHTLAVLGTLFAALFHHTQHEAGGDDEIDVTNLSGLLADPQTPVAHTHTESDITDLDHTDANAIHDNVAGEITAVAEKAVPVDADVLLIEDSEDGNAKKKVQIGNLPGGTGGGTHTAIFTVTDELEIATGKIRIYNITGSSVTISKVFLAIDTAPTGAAVLVDIHKDGVTIFTNQAHRPQIAAGANTGYSADIDVSAWADGAYLTMDIDQIGSTIKGSDLTVHVLYA